MNDVAAAMLAGVPIRCVPKDACLRCVPDIEIRAVVMVLGWLPLCVSCEAVLQAELAVKEAQR